MMRKAELQKLRTLAATPKMMRIAADDVPQRTIEKSCWGSTYERVTSEYGLFLRCQVLQGILKVAIFLPDAMRLGGRLPLYEIYVNKETGEFLTYDRPHKNWLTSKLDRLQWPREVHNGKKRWINQEGYASIKSYLGTEKGGYEGLLEYQFSIRAQELKARHRKETAPWDKDLAQTPELPKDWNRWVDKVGIPENYIFYQYARDGAKTGYCTFCGKDVPVVNPRHNRMGRCRCCRHKITFKAAGKMPGVLQTPRYAMYLVQRCADGFMIREFRGYRKYLKGDCHVPEVRSWETRRAIFDANAKPLRAYYWGDYKLTGFRWIRTDCCSLQWGGEEPGRCYGKTISTLAARELRFTGLPEMIRGHDFFDPEKYLTVWNEVPQLERLPKAGLYGLAKDCLNNYHPFREMFQKNRSGGLAKQLGIDAQEMKRLRENGGGLAYLDWLRFEKSTGKPLPDRAIRWLCQEDLRNSSLKFIFDRMSIVQTVNYVSRQMRETGMRSRDVLTTWRDYLSMAKRLGMDTNDAIIYRVRKLRQRHDELVKQMQAQELSIEAGKILEKYPHLEEIFGEIKEIYTYEGKEFAVLVPARIEEIMHEGRKLCHCVGSSDRYWERIERRESYILFLRRLPEAEKAFYTLEVEPDGTVRQKRTMYDRQDRDIDTVMAFLKEWQKAVAKRITEKERSLAQTSRILRTEEFAQLQKDGVIIRAGDLQGRPLADVLLADLMEQSEETAQAALPAAA